MKTLQTNAVVMLMAIAVVGSVGGSFALIQQDQPTASGYSEDLAIVGHVELKVTDNETGQIKAYRQSDNVVVNDGLETILDLTFGNTISGDRNGVAESIVDFLALGNQVAPAAAAVGNTGLQAEVALCARVALADSASAGQQVVITGTFDASTDADCAVTVTELGLFTEAASGGADQLFARQSSFASIVLTTSDSLQVTWTVGMADDGVGT